MNKREKFAFALVGALAMTTSSFAFAVSSSSSAKVIYGCVASSSGSVTKLTSKKPKCPKGTTLLTLNVQGPQGNQGLQGPKGDQGLQGPEGDQGLQGISETLEKYFIESPDGKIRYEYSVKDQKVLIDGLWWKLDESGTVVAPEFAQQTSFGVNKNSIFGAMVFDQLNCVGQSGWLTDADQRYVTIDSHFVKKEAVSFFSGMDNNLVGKNVSSHTGSLTAGSMNLGSIKSYQRNGSCVAIQNVDKVISNAYTAAIRASQGVSLDEGGNYVVPSSSWSEFYECLTPMYDEFFGRDTVPTSWACLPTISNPSAYHLLYETGIFSKITDLNYVMAMRTEGINSGLDLSFTVYDYKLTPKPGNLIGGWKVVEG